MTPNGVSAPCGRDDRHLVADPQAQVLGELGADRDALPRVEPVERALGDVAGDARQALEVLLADAAHQRARRAVLRGGEGLALDQRQRQRHAGNLAHPLRHRVVVGQRRLDPLQEHVAVEADHLLHQVVAEAVHHRHDDDQRRDPEHDAEEGEAGDDRDRLLRVAGAQVAERHHPLERRERPRRAGRRRRFRRRRRSCGASPTPAPRIAEGEARGQATAVAATLHGGLIGLAASAERGRHADRT